MLMIMMAAIRWCRSVRIASTDLNFTAVAGDYLGGDDPGDWLAGSGQWLSEQILERQGCGQSRGNSPAWAIRWTSSSGW